MLSFGEILAGGWLWLLISLIVGFLLAWLFMARPASGRASAAEQQASELQSKLSASNRSIDDAKKESQALRQQLETESKTLTEARGISEQQKSFEAEQGQQLSATKAEIESLKATLQFKDEELANANAKLAGPLRLFEKMAGVSADAISIDHITPAKTPAILAGIMGGVTTHLVKNVQDMAVIPGIGNVSENKLYEAGVGTYWEVANLTDEALIDILQPSAGQKATLDLARVRTEALALAQRTETVGAIWNARQVDNLDSIQGISSTFEQRLYDAGISTYKDLAGATIDQLAEICRPPATMMPNYAAWIAKAQELSQQSSASAPKSA